MKFKYEAKTNAVEFLDECLREYNEKNSNSSPTGICLGLKFFDELRKSYSPDKTGDIWYKGIRTFLKPELDNELELEP